MKINLDYLKDKKVIYSITSIILLLLIGGILGKIFFFDEIIYLKNKLEQKKIYEYEISDFNNQILDLEQQLGPIELEQKNLSRLFHNKNEIENLYQELSTIAISNGLIIANLEKKDKEAYDISGQKIDNIEEFSAADIFYMIPVDYKIIGNFINYLRFRSQVADLPKSLNFQSEQISLSEEEGKIGEINSTATIAVFSLEGN